MTPPDRTQHTVASVRGQANVQLLLRPIKSSTIQDSFWYRSNTAPCLGLPVKTMFLDNMFFHVQWVKRFTGIGGENDRDLFKAWNWSSSGKALLNGKVAHREVSWAGQRYGHSCTEHRDTSSSSWASRSGKECSPAGIILWYLLFFSFTPGASGKLLPGSPPEKVAWIRMDVEDYSLACRGLSGTPKFPQLKPGATLDSSISTHK